VLDKAELPGFYRDAIVGPNEAALVIRNGRLEEVVTEVRLGASGFRDRLKGLIGRDSDVQVIFVDTSPFDLTFFLGESTRGEQGGFRQDQQSTVQRGSNITMGAERTGGASTAQGSSVQSQLDSASVAIEALTSDRQFVSAQIRLTFAIGIDDTESVARLLRGRTALAVADIAALIRDELISKVLVPMVARNRADELRGNKGLLSEISGATERELSTAAGLWGLTLHNFFLNWGVTDQERAEIEEARKRREEETAEFAHQRVIRERERGLDLERTRLNNLQELKVLDVRGGEELKEVYLNSEIDRAQLLDGQRVSVAGVDAQIRSIEMGIRREEADLQAEIDQRRKEMELENQRRQSQLRLEELEGQSRLEMSELEHAVNLQSRRREERHLQDLERERQRLDLSRERIRSQESIIARALDTGAADASVLRTLLEQSTDQEYAQTSDAMVQARSEAQAARYSLEVAREEQDRERSHQADMTRLSADMMEASKQNPTVVTPGLPLYGGIHPAPPGNVTHVNNVPGPAAAPEAPASACPSCATPVPGGSKFCPHCGSPMAVVPQCPGCKSSIEVSWKHCPNCGHNLK
jgi:RNA polymerase subunit RPABC4/transcription elongation factor Spt4